MAEGNGVDLGAIYQRLSMVAADVRKKANAADVVELGKELRAEMAGIRQAMIPYQSSVLGHGILISELEARVRRVGDHLRLPPLIDAE